ncbi:MAG: STAS domain-containing protein [Phycisphaerales bacterium]|nr:STAS domain-containing protein [Phycisphaerales bacterium]MCB9841362.1 STAS domain-containing protein [Phycisphaeraceae bacterium]
MLDSTYLIGEYTDGVLVASVKTEKVGEYEAQIIAAELKEALSKGKPRLVLDMQAVLLLASAGIGMLLDLFRHCQSGGGKFAMCAMDEDVLGSLRVTKMDRLFNIKKDRASALAVMV